MATNPKSSRVMEGTPRRGEAVDDEADRRIPAGAPESVPPERSGLRRVIEDHRRSLLILLVMGVAIVFVFAVLPQLAGFGKSLHRLRDGSKGWLAAGLGLESISLLGYMALFRMIFSCEGVRIGWRSSYQVTLAGAVATKLIAAGGAGGIALTVWALRAAGLSPRAVARRMTSFEILLYTVFMTALVVFGGGMAAGLFPGHGGSGLAVPLAVFGAVVIVLVPALGFAAHGAEQWLSRLAQRSRRGRGLLQKLTTVPSTLKGGIQTTGEILRHPRPGLAGALVYWAFDIATLWAGFKAFGASPPIAAVVLAYYVGQLANALPLPGGIGGVEGGMIGAFIAFGVSGSTAVLAVLAYRIISFWLPILPGSIAYLRLRSAVAHWHEADAAQAPG
ncbi:MAG TPA: lysylphosphatidylglycerol synthase transmembrane domain-containing protein [Solirubrobacteraceae bacterium]|jgi:uncharacterized protein (TIRG00374 family)|nr:lysylphosphatidylglycerol synthase transmembrane domain-containing protein [Solirubrobacteraceae bacterium]